MWWLTFLTQRRILIGFLSAFVVLECTLFVLHEMWWLPELNATSSLPSSLSTMRDADHKSSRRRRGATNRQEALVGGQGTMSSSFALNQGRLADILQMAAAQRQEWGGSQNGPHRVKGQPKVQGDKVVPMIVPKLHSQALAGIHQVPNQWNSNSNPPLVAKKQAPHHAMANNKKQQQQHSSRWDPGAEGLHQPPVPIQVTTPIFVASLPKSGTTSLWQYFQCGGRKAAHQWVKKSTTNGQPPDDKQQQVQAGICLRDNIQAGRPPLEGCGDYDVYTDTGYSLFVATGVSDCYYPSMSALPELYQHYPQATIINVVRNATDWYQSMRAWGDGSLLQRWKNCNLTAAANLADPHDFVAFYQWHTRHVRDFCFAHPSLTYIEVALDSPATGPILEERIGIPARCWGKCTPASKWCDRVNHTTTTTTTSRDG